MKRAELPPRLKVSLGRGEMGWGGQCRREVTLPNEVLKAGRVGDNTGKRGRTSPKEGLLRAS